MYRPQAHVNSAFSISVTAVDEAFDQRKRSSGTYLGNARSLRSCGALFGRQPDTGMSMGCGAGTREIRPAERTKASSKVRAKARSAFIVWSGESRGRKLGARPHGFLRSQGEKLPLDADVSARFVRRGTGRLFGTCASSGVVGNLSHP